MAALLDWRARLVARREERRLAAERKAEVERIAAELAQRMAMAPERYRWSAALLTAAVRGWHTRYLLRKEADRLRRASAAALIQQSTRVRILVRLGRPHFLPRRAHGAPPAPSSPLSATFSTPPITSHHLSSTLITSHHLITCCTVSPFHLLCLPPSPPRSSPRRWRA